MTTASLENLAAEPVRWNRFLAEIFQDNTELIEFIQRSVGYAMTGEIRENVLFILHGDGANGKSTLIETVTHILGDYAKPAAPDLLLRKRSESHPTGVADLMGARFVSSVEADDGKKLSEAVVKRLTGRDTIKARFMAQDFFEFEPSHKLFLAVNHKPEVEGQDQGIWRRIRLIPFEVEIPEEKQDTKLLDKLLQEGEEILAWAIRGCLAWQNDGLGLPVAVKEASQAYREESDVIGRFFDDCCILESGHQTQASVLYQAFRNWCERNGEKGYAANKFGGLIGKEKQLEKIRTRIDKKSCYVWKGIGVLSHLEHNQETSFESTTRTSNPVIDEILGIQLE
jgi:putative DNA primase/helicase